MTHRSLTLINEGKAPSATKSKRISANFEEILSFLSCEKLQTLRECYYTLVKQYPGLSVKAYKELLRRKGIQIESNNIAPRFTELRDAKLIYAIETLNEDGSQQWVVTPGVSYHAGWVLYAATANKTKKKNGLSKLDKHLKKLQTILRAQILSEHKNVELIQMITSCIEVGMSAGEKEFFHQMKILKTALTKERIPQKKSLADAA